MGTFYVENFGCRATQADGAAIECQFHKRGLERAAAPEQANVVVFNTCTVTAAADQDARAAIRRIHRNNPGCQIVVTGCYAQRAPEEIAALPGVSQVIGNSHKPRLAEIALPLSEPRAAKAALDFATFAAPALVAEGKNFLPLSSLMPEGRVLTSDARGQVFVSDIFAHTILLAAPVFDAANERTRPNLKVQDGCDNRCSFCVIPYVRGNSRSLPLDQVLREVNALVDGGYREVVISGINLGRWGRDLPCGAEASACAEPVSARLKSYPDTQLRGESCVLPGFVSGHGFSHAGKVAASKPALPAGITDASRRCRFEDLVRSILDYTALEKLRISSVEPMDWSDELIRLVADSPRVAKHAHVPMQSGSDRVLRLMHRKYRPWHYREKIEEIRAAVPTAAIGADVMAGFPGETDPDFEETRRMVEELPFTYLHVFTYSARPGTPAAAMRNQVPVHIARERNRILRDLAAEKKVAFMQSFIGNPLEAITLNVVHSGPAAAATEAITINTPPSPCHSERREEPTDFAEQQGVSQGRDSAFTEALTDNYLKLRLKGRHAPNRWLTAQVEQVEGGALVGVVS